MQKLAKACSSCVLTTTNANMCYCFPFSIFSDLSISIAQDVTMVKRHQPPTLSSRLQVALDALPLKVPATSSDRAPSAYVPKFHSSSINPVLAIAALKVPKSKPNPTVKTSQARPVTAPKTSQDVTISGAS